MRDAFRDQVTFPRASSRGSEIGSCTALTSGPRQFDVGFLHAQTERSCMNTQIHGMLLKPSPFHHRRDVRVLPTHPTLETKKFTTNKVGQPHVKKPLKAHEVKRSTLLFVCGFGEHNHRSFKLRNGYAYNPSQSHTTNLDAVTRGAWTRREQEEKEVASHQ